MDRFLSAGLVTGACAALLACNGITSTERAGPEQLGETPDKQQELACTKIPTAPLRRLSRAEYIATVKDLFPTLSLGDFASLPQDPTAAGFENRASLLNPTPPHIEQF